MKRRNRNQKGFIVSTELMLIATILVIGLIVGLQAVRVSVVTELADVGGAIASVAQTYSWSGVAGHHASTNGSIYTDSLDTCDDAVAQPAGANSRCVRICGADAGTTPTVETAAPIPQSGTSGF
jgi:hypothetical protein